MGYARSIRFLGVLLLLVKAPQINGLARTHRIFPRSSLRVRRPSSILHSPSATTTCTSLRRFPLQSTASASSNDEPPDSSVPQKFHWTRPTLAIALPALIGMLADPLLSLMDTAFVGNVVGPMELASLGACTSIFHLAFNAFRATTAATTSLVARSLSNTDTSAGKQEARHVTKISLQFGFVLGILVLLFLQLGGSWCLNTMGISQTSPLFAPAHAYLQARSWAAPAVLSMVVAEGAFRGYGNTKIPLLASFTAAFINLILDPLFMLPPLQWGVAGAASATAISQFGAWIVYAFQLKRYKMLPQTKSKKKNSNYKVNVRQVIQTILQANMAMMAKQGSLLLAWAYATSRATRLGPAHVAAHQIALSFWLVFAIWLDGAAVSAQVLMSRAAARSLQEVRSLTNYMIRFATLQGVASSLVIWASGTLVTHLFTPDVTIQKYLTQLIPHLAGQQVLISLTLVMESLAVGGHQFNLLALGTTISTVIAMTNLQHSTDVVSIWSRGIVALFVGRLVTSCVGCARVNRVFAKRSSVNQENDDGKDELPGNTNYSI